MEEWKLIPESEGRYSISSLGRVRREAYSYVFGGRVVSYEEAIINRKVHRDYAMFSFRVNSKRFNFAIHRIVAKEFIPNPDNKPFVNHKDLDKLNNAAANLEWVTGSENAQHAINNVMKSKYTMIKPCELTPLHGEVFKLFCEPEILVSNFGRVYGWYKNYTTFLNPRLKRGYLSVHGKSKRGRFGFSVHRAVASLFVENKHGFSIVNHLDGDVFNNSFENLEWCSNSRNSKHAFETGLNKKTGENHNACKHSTETVIKVIDLIKLGKSYTQIKTETGVSTTQISNIKHGHTRSYCTGIKLVEKKSLNSLTIEEVAELKRLLFFGVDKKELADRFKTTTRNVTRISNGGRWAYVAPEYTIGLTRRVISDSDKDDIVSMIKNGFKTKDIAIKFNCAECTVNAIKRKLNGQA